MKKRKGGEIVMAKVWQQLNVGRGLRGLNTNYLLLVLMINEANNGRLPQ